MPSDSAPPRSDAMGQAPGLPSGWIQPAMGAGVGAVMTARPGGHSAAPYAACNLGDHVGDAPDTVALNRAEVAALLGARPVWLTQVHGRTVARLTADSGQDGKPIEADGALTTEPGVACAVMVADCLPVLLAAPEGRGVAALHAGWRGLAGAGDLLGRGIVEEGVAALCEAAACDPADLYAWLGPCIGPAAFEVGPDVLLGFGVRPGDPHPRFVPRAGGSAEGDPRWLADLSGLARDRLVGLGVRAAHTSGGLWCTFSEPSRFFSFRRDRRTGRQAACIWIDPRR